jgi:charged multivesicular body protein 5
MHRLFGKPKGSGGGDSGGGRPEKDAPPQPPSIDDATKSIQVRIGDLDVKIKGCNDELMKYNEQMKKTAGSAKETYKKRALDVLKRKRMYESQRDQLSNQVFNLDQTAFAIETVKATQVTVQAMKSAATVLKAENQKISLDEIEDMQDDMEELLEDCGEISDILSRNYATPDGVDEADLEAELNCLEDEFESISMEAPSQVSANSSAADIQYPSLPNRPQQQSIFNSEVMMQNN